MNCLGYIARDRGQSRVPEPPQRITGKTDVVIRLSRPTNGLQRMITSYIDFIKAACADAERSIDHLALASRQPVAIPARTKSTLAQE
jgi:hypothetical protein